MPVISMMCFGDGKIEYLDALRSWILQYQPLNYKFVVLTWKERLGALSIEPHIFKDFDTIREKLIERVTSLRHEVEAHVSNKLVENYKKLSEKLSLLSQSDCEDMKTFIKDQTEALTAKIGESLRKDFSHEYTRIDNAVIEVFDIGEFIKNSGVNPTTIAGYRFVDFLISRITMDSGNGTMIPPYNYISDALRFVCLQLLLIREPNEQVFVLEADVFACPTLGEGDLNLEGILDQYNDEDNDKILSIANVLSMLFANSNAIGAVKACGKLYDAQISEDGHPQTKCLMSSRDDYTLIRKRQDQIQGCLDKLGGPNASLLCGEHTVPVDCRIADHRATSPLSGNVCRYFEYGYDYKHQMPISSGNTMPEGDNASDARLVAGQRAAALTVGASAADEGATTNESDNSPPQAN